MKNHVSNHKLPNLSLIVFLVSISITGSGIMLSSPVTSAYGESSSSGYSSKTLSGTHIVSIIGINKDKSFDPNPIEIKAGDSVTWTNDDDDIHKVTSGSSEGPTIGRDFDSGTLASGESFTHKFDNPGALNIFVLFMNL